MSQQPTKFGAPMKPQHPKKSGGNSGKATASLVLGIVSFFGACFTGIPGLILGIMGLGDISKSGGRLQGKGMAIAGIVLSSIGIFWTLILGGILAGMLLPAVQQVRTAARRATSMNNVRQQILSMHNYASAHRSLPKPEMGGLSWRVHMLPFLEEDLLYSQFRLDEPWDSSHNMQLLDQMPSVYDNPNLVLPPGMTVYQVAYTDTANSSGQTPSAMFDTSDKDLRFADVIDGTSNTIAIVEVNASAAVEWTRPADWEFDPYDPTRDLGGNWPGGVTIVAFADGSCQIITIDNMDLETMKGLLTRDGGEVTTIF